MLSFVAFERGTTGYFVDIDAEEHMR
ncbi:hypothetical protein EMEDMD4_1310016 [Sinorhizobium medicae]|uniref:Uncharacterized protein n=1 Tax=Sinorhizobium medicae TaxID=110321 RepID=A0A508WRQ1_9HYPH|nr:hypothetical protein EMEDMD4_1310016 [Sinorhizobium medicae]